MLESARPLSTPHRRLGLGLDAGGTATRWALADADGHPIAEGLLAPIAGAMWAQGDAGRQAMRAVFGQAFAEAARAAAQALPGAPPLAGAWAGITGLAEEHADAVATALAAACALPRGAVDIVSDVVLACRAAFCPGEGLVVYAGTGSVAAHLASDGRTLERAGGRGPVIDDAGGGYWLGARALRTLWRREDGSPGHMLDSALGREVAGQLGGSDWATHRAFVIRASRGEIGLLGLAVARAANAGDDEARALLLRAGDELAALALPLMRRTPVRAIALAGRVWDLHPAIAEQFESRIAPRWHGVAIKRLTRSPHHAAAVLAAGGSPE
jgi:N-acetylglucosamine kinase-like BadF-type ATPase